MCSRSSATRCAASARVIGRRISRGLGAGARPHAILERDMPQATAKGTTASVQDYLAAIYDLQSSGKPVIGARLAKHMGISAPAVTEAIRSEEHTSELQSQSNLVCRLLLETHNKSSYT